MLLSRSLLAPRVGSRVGPSFGLVTLSNASSFQAFSSSRPSASDLAKLVLIGRMGKTPETRTTKTDKEYVTWVLGRTPAARAVR